MKIKKISHLCDIFYFILKRGIKIMTKRLPSRLNKLLYLFSFLVNTNIMITLLLYLVNILPTNIAGIMVIIYITLQLYVVCNYDKMVI